MLKKLWIVAGLLLVIGIVGSVLTFQKEKGKEMITEEKVIEDAFDDININVDDTKLVVKQTTNEKASIELKGKSIEAYQLSTHIKDSTLQIKLKHQSKKLFNLDFLKGGNTLTVLVPEKDYAHIQTKSDNGHVVLEHMKATVIHVNADNGRIELNDVESEKVDVEAANGEIHLNEVVAKSVEVNADNGNILLDNVDHGKILSRTDNGKVKLKTNNLDRPINIETDNGRIDIETTKKPESVIFDVKVDNGTTEIFGKKNWDTVIGEGDHPIKLTADNGKITISQVD